MGFDRRRWGALCPGPLTAGAYHQFCWTTIGATVPMMIGSRCKAFLPSTMVPPGRTSSYHCACTDRAWHTVTGGVRDSSGEPAADCVVAAAAPTMSRKKTAP